MNYFVGYEEDNIKKWEVIPEKDRDSFLMSILMNTKIDNHKVFVIPLNGMIEGIWLYPKNHKSSRVDFWNFYEDYGQCYVRPEIYERAEELAEELEDQIGYHTKYGWISPEGKYFHCEFQGHIGLARRICFGVYQTDNPERYLEEHGWCKIYKPLLKNQYSIYVHEDFKLTDAQLQTLISMELTTNCNISQYL